MESKPKLFVQDEVCKSGSYTYTRIKVSMGSEETLNHKIDQCEGNKAGYGTESACEEMRRTYTWLRTQGYRGVYSEGWATLECVTFEWQHYEYDGESRFGEMSVRLPARLSHVRKSAKLLERVIAYASKLGHHDWALSDDPKFVRDVLARMKATPIAAVEISSDVSGKGYSSTEYCTARTLASVSAHKAA